MKILIWIGILFCISQSAIFSGLNLAFFSITKLNLEIESKRKNKAAIRIAALRKNSNFLLTTILWGNVGINVLLTLLSNSVMAGLSAFLFSTIIITFLGEIIPQAYFSRHAIKTASFLSPLLRIYQILLYPVAKPSAWILDIWLGPEAINFFKEKDIREMLKMHIDAPETEITLMEGKGAINFLIIDDLPVSEEGELVNPNSIFRMKFERNKPCFDTIESSCEDAFLMRIHKGDEKWIILTDESDNPRLVLNADAFLRAKLFDNSNFNPHLYCHHPVILHDGSISLEKAIVQLRVEPEDADDDVIDKDVILVWGKEKRIITGSDILGRLLRGIVKNNAHA